MVGAAILIAALAGQTVGGATASSVKMPSASCRIVDVRHGRGMPEVYAACGSLSVRLGPADTFISSINIASGKALVVRQRAARLDVVLVSQSEGGVPVIQDVSRDVVHSALEAGIPRGATPTVDLSRFAATGTLVLSSATSGGSKTATIDLTSKLRSGS